MKRLALFALSALSIAAVCVPSANASDYRTVSAATILYDGPSQKDRKLFVIRRDTPVEVVIGGEEWLKVRDAEGALAWIEKKFLSDKRSLIVLANRAQIRQKADESAPLVFEAEKNVALEYLETAPGGWIKVRHRDAQAGFVRANQVWGF